MPQPQIESNADEKDVSTASQPRSTMSLKAKVALRLSLGLVIGPSIVFIPAGTWKFWQGWVFLAILYVPAFAIFLYFLKHDPQLCRSSNTTSNYNLKLDPEPALSGALSGRLRIHSVRR